MNNEQSPPRMALWILTRLYPKRNREAVAGDLIERFREGRSAGWFWYQALTAVFLGASSFLGSLCIDICFASVGTAVMWCVPWANIFPIAAMTTGAELGTGPTWLIAIELASALIVLPVFAVRFLVAGILRPAKLIEVFLTFFVLVGLGDVVSLRWELSHPHLSHFDSTGLVAAQLVWIFVSFLISERLPRSRRLWPAVSSCR
jgi:hypothetical protein